MKPKDTPRLDVTDLTNFTHKEAFGWFGDAWPSYVCYDDTGRELTEMNIPVPVGDSCFWCNEMFVQDDQGKAMPYHNGEATRIVYVHKECMLREVMGPLAHLEKRCMCYGGTDHETPGFTARQEAQAVWNWVAEHGA